MISRPFRTCFLLGFGAVTFFVGRGAGAVKSGTFVGATANPIWKKCSLELPPPTSRT